MSTKKYYPLHPDIHRAIDLYQTWSLDGFDDEGILEWLDDAIDQLMERGLLRVSLTEEYPVRKISNIESAVGDFLRPLKIAVERGLVQIEPRPAEDQEPLDTAPMLCQKQIITFTDHGWNVFSRIFPEMKEYENESDGYDEDDDEAESEYSPDETPPDDREKVLSALKQEPWQNLWATTFRGWSQERCDLLTELEEQGLIEGRYPDKNAADIHQEFMLTSLGAHTLLHDRCGYDAPNQYRSRITRRLVRQARSLLEQLGYEILGLEPRIFKQRICLPDITAQKDGKRIYAMVESEDLIVPEAVDKYHAFWQADNQGRIADNMYVFCQNNQVLRDVMHLITTNFDLKPPAIYLCNLEEAERTMQTKNHPWSIIQVSREQESPRQESGTIEPKENNP